MEQIDDILIANNIANSANGEKTESYHYWWSWQDAAHHIQNKLERSRSRSSQTKSINVSFLKFVCFFVCRYTIYSFGNYVSHNIRNYNCNNRDS